MKFLLFSYLNNSKGDILMKRTLLVLASLMAIALLSCSDNSNPLAGEMYLPQEQTLPKVITSDEIQQTCSSQKYQASQSIGASSTVIGTIMNSPEYAFTLPKTLPKDAVITNIEIKTGSFTYNGGVLINYFKIRKGLYDYDLIYGNVGNTTIGTHYFDGELARDTYYVSLNATCLSLSPIGVGGICSKLYTRVELTIYYCQP
jgi:hypothetical protein